MLLEATFGQKIPFKKKKTGLKREDVIKLKTQRA